MMMVMVVSGRPLMVLKRQTADDDAGDADGDADDDADFSVRWRMAGTGILRCQGRSSYSLEPGKFAAIVLRACKQMMMMQTNDDAHVAHACKQMMMMMMLVVEVVDNLGSSRQSSPLYSARPSDQEVASIAPKLEQRAGSTPAESI